MLDIIITALALVGAALGTPLAQSGLKGFDISSYEDSVDFHSAHTSGVRFVIAKATEGTSYIDRTFQSHFEKSLVAGLYRGAYHFAHPDRTTGEEQAQYFLSHGGKWTKDGKTLPGMLDIEYNPSGSTCYGMSASAMTAWVASFVNSYHGSTGRYPMIYTTQDWWSTCTGDATDFADKCPLVLARYGSSPGKLPGGWKTHTIWQSSDKFSFGGDADIFNGSEDDMNRLAHGSWSTNSSASTATYSSTAYPMSTMPAPTYSPTGYPVTSSAPAPISYPTQNSTTVLSTTNSTISSTSPPTSSAQPYPVSSYPSYPSEAPCPEGTQNSTQPYPISTSATSAPPCPEETANSTAYTISSTLSTRPYPTPILTFTTQPYPILTYPSDPTSTPCPEESLKESIAKLRQ